MALQTIEATIGDDADSLSSDDFDELHNLLYNLEHQPHNSAGTAYNQPSCLPPPLPPLPLARLARRWRSKGRSRTAPPPAATASKSESQAKPSFTL